MQFAPVYPILYRILKPTFPNCLWSGSENSPAIALTFDDGPHPNYTPELLSILDRYQIKASFFWLGACVARNPTLAREVYRRGHWLGLHGYYHNSFPFLSENNLKQSLEKTQEAIFSSCGLQPDKIRDVRPPNGIFTPQTLKLLKQWNYRTVMWSVVPEDWENPGITVVRQRVLKQVKNGALIVLHDGNYGGKDVAQITADLIERLLAQSYHFVTIDQFWQQKTTT
ncbi:MAG: polysaccharide deacetylase family protein [Moorea sp. SIO2B7]|nr:polysaccharide deacetylase family protein [Moorena sp. SIO2B7]